MFHLTHKELVEVAYRWILKNGGVGVAFKELYTAACNGEYPDVIGFASGCHSVLIECKVSRSDFLADRKKLFRKEPVLGMGSYRYYCCPSGLIKVDELPEGWGLIYENNGKAKLVHKPVIELQTERGYPYKTHYRHEKNIRAEQGVMYSALRRLFIKGYMKHIYDQQYAKGVSPNDLITLNENSEE